MPHHRLGRRAHLSFDEPCKFAVDHLLRLVYRSGPVCPVFVGNRVELVERVYVHTIQVRRFGRHISRHAEIEDVQRAAPACFDGLIQAIGIEYRLGRGGAGDHNVGCLQRVESLLERHYRAAKLGCQLGGAVGAAAGHCQPADAVAPKGACGHRPRLACANQQHRLA